MGRFIALIREHFVLTGVLVVALTATAYAALDPIGSDGDVDACFAKKNGALSLQTGKKCPKGTKPVSWAEEGPAGPPGPAGRSALQTLRSGETVRGVIGSQVQAAAGGTEFYELGSLPVPAPAPLGDGDVIVDGPYEDSTTCQGSFSSPTAPPGKLCIYDQSASAVGTNTIEEEGTAAGGFGGSATPYGFGLRFYSDAAGDTAINATWAYRAP